MPLTRPTIDFIRERGVRDGSSPRETFGPDETSTDATFFVPFAQRHDAVIYFLGYSQFETSGATVVRLQRLTPKQHVDAGGAFQYASKIPNITHHKFDEKSTSIDTGASRNRFVKSELSVMYEAAPYPVLEDSEVAADEEWQRFCYPSAIRPSAEYLSLPSGVLRYVKTDSTSLGRIPYGVGKVISITEVDIKWVGLPLALYTLSTTPSPWQKRIWGYNASGIKPAIGRINSTQMWGWSPGTALLMNVGLELRKDPVVGLSWDVTFTFGVNTNGDGKGWNYLYYFATDNAVANGWYFAGKTGTYYAPGSVPDGESLYDETNLLLNCFKVAT